jgi:hypothetical protein
MSKIDRVINYFRNLREDAPVMTSSPTMSSGDQPFSSSSNPEGPNAGFTPVMSFRRRQNGKIDGRSAPKKYKDWLKSLGLL